MEKAIKLVAPKHKADTQRIAETIMKQIKCPNISVYWSWGAHNFCYAETEDGKPCLRFKVNGNKHKGYVHIIYNWMDYYEVEFVSTQGNLKKRVDECYFDNLREVIDEFVEKIPEYVF